MLSCFCWNAQPNGRRPAGKVRLRRRKGFDIIDLLLSKGTRPHWLARNSMMNVSGFGGKCRVGRKWPAYAALALGMAGHAAAALAADEPATPLSAELKDRYEQMQDDVPNRVPMLSLTPAASGRAGQMEALVRQCMNEQLQKRNDYSLELQRAGAAVLLDMKRIREDNAVEESRTIVENLRAAAQRHRYDMDAVPGCLEDNLGKLKLSKAAKKDFMRGVSAGMAKSRYQAERIWTLEFALIDQMAAATQYLTANKNYWSIDDSGRMAYASPQVKAQAESMLAVLGKLRDQQRELGRQGVANGLANMRKAGM
ncbi:hypothetical protein KIF53_20105 [Chromobacterium subtsugae]|uniref:Uncharacterized protein n=1 Tax=Chromobacterium subtsugae TaxID=251747 RepID=A0ABS7FIY1_9NEIS|nr:MULTISPECIES: hypothetical protein [Chromobacterium]MBW7568934.1 hypothetical protein [Chromobacterium subtsugae]MBW8289946.1 hypothetical protein [Chromobacterium subtsugae]WSE92483.1 hypothetical protein U6115_04305 [Chromobacterium subtsugae]WVH60861.1 hypothetical protein U6151_04325 [Chromobacterium subtsugae]